MKHAIAERKNRSFLTRMQFALNGLRIALINESSFRIQTVCAALVVVVVLLARPSLLWTSLLLLSVALVLALELVNSAVETALDRLHPEINKDIGAAKDLLAAAVLVASSGALIAMICFLVSPDSKPLFALFGIDRTP